MNGYQVAEVLRNDPETKKVTMIALTGYGQPKDKLLALEAGFDHHLTKPIDTEQLRSLISSAPK